ncbi:MAG: hypothetical protein DYG89_50390 [Caldilinea sp. CFX5]|nr:hypothetical protein [Caldilinea sp. CFX5]
MKKSSKQKKNKQKEQALQPKPQQKPDLLVAAKAEEQPLPATEGIDAAPLSPTLPAEQATMETGGEAAVNQDAPLNAAAFLKQKAALVAQNQQRNQWNQQRKAGKMVNAHVPKRFNRGG